MLNGILQRLGVTPTTPITMQAVSKALPRPANVHTIEGELKANNLYRIVGKSKTGKVTKVYGTGRNQYQALKACKV